MREPNREQICDAAARYRPRVCIPSMQDQKTSWIALSSAELNVEVNPLGAQLSVLRDASGHELLWNGDPAVWAGRAPLLFPIVGTLAGGSYRVGSKVYSLPRHGFARVRPFDIVAASSS